MHNYSILFTNEYVYLSFVFLDNYASLITKGSFPYSSKQQEVPVAWHPPVQNIAIQPISGSCTIHATLQVKFCVKQLEQITGKMQTSHCEDTSEKNIESHSRDNWTNSSRICSFFLANILMCNERLIYM